MIAAAALQGCNVVVLPECLDVGSRTPTPSLWPNRYRVRAADSTAGRGAERRILVVAGLTERLGTSIYNSAVLLGRDGLC